MIDAAIIERAAERVRAVVRTTPVLTSRTISALVGGEVLLKAENLQRTGSFKLRGAFNKLAVTRERGALRGAVTGSAGNHAQSLAYAARELGIPCEVFMPSGAAVSKVAATRAQGATVQLGGASVEACIELARARAEESGFTFVHPFDDVDVIAGQASLGRELIAQRASVAKAIVPVGGGGLAAGVAIALKRADSRIAVVGVQAGACPSAQASLDAGEPIEVGRGTTLADGIAVKRPGALTFPLLRDLLDDLVVVDEDQVADAMVLLMERCKLVVEGAGAVGLAALMSGLVEPAAHGETVVVLSGGNVDVGVLAAVARHHETGAQRRLRLFARLADTPGTLAGLLVEVGRRGGNLVEVEHVREGVPLHVGETGVELIVEVRGPEHGDQLLQALATAGYDVSAGGLSPVSESPG